MNATDGAGKGPDARALPKIRRCEMPTTAEQYRAKAAEFRALLTKTPHSPDETRELRDLAQTYTTLAENEEWMAGNTDKVVPRRTNYDNRAVPAEEDNRTVLAEEEEQILKCLGAALIMRWNTVPTKLQRELFDCAGSLDDLQQSQTLRERIARFLHDHKNDQQRSE
jgi:hypothetical protein